MSMSDTGNAGNPVFILSLKRSGSTLLRNVVDAHPAVFASAFAIGPLCDALNSTHYLAQARSPNGGSEPQRRALALEKTRAAVAGLMSEYTKASQARLWCDKSLVNLPHLPLIDQVFPNAKYVCLYRHCLDFVHSYLSMSRLGFLPEICGHVQKSPHNVVAAIAEYWLERNGAIQEFEKANAGRCFRVNYESLASQPGDTLTELFGFLGLEWDDSLLEKTFGKPTDGFAEGDIKFHFSKKVHTGSIGGGASLPANTIPAPLRARIDALLGELGYSAQQALQDAASAEDVAAPKGAVASVLEQFRAAIDEQGDYAKAIGGTCKLVVNGREPGEWTIDLTKPKAVIEPGGRATDCVISLAADTLIELAAGKRSVVDAFENGAIGIAGNVSLATSFGKLLLG